MPFLSELLQGKSQNETRRLYTLFQRATKRGEVPALKLLTRFQITGAKGQPRQVADYAFTDADAGRVQTWLQQQERQAKQPKGLTAEQVKVMSDEELKRRIEEAQKPKQTRRKRKRKSEPAGA